MIYNFFKEGIRQIRRSLDHILSPELVFMERKLEKKRLVIPVWSQQKLAWQKLRYSYYAGQKRTLQTLSAVLLLGLIMAGAAFPRIAYQVMIEDTCIGTVRSTTTVKEIVDSHLVEIGLEIPYQLVVDPVITYYPTRQREKLTSVEQLRSSLLDAITVKAHASVVYISDKTSVALVSAADVNQMLDYVKLYYIDNRTALETLQAQFTDALTVRREIVDLDQIKTVEQATTLLVSGSERKQVVTIIDGDTPWSVAMSQSISVDELLANNPEAANMLPGDQLIIKQAEPLIGVVTNETTREETIIAYDTETRYSDTAFVTDIEEKVSGLNGLTVEEFVITRQNGEEVNRVSLGISVAREPVNRVIVKGTKLPYGVGTGTFVRPLQGGITAAFGFGGYGSYSFRFHSGIDISSGGYGTIVAADSGVIVDIGIGYNGGYGNSITIDHNNGMRTKYCHLSSINVSYGQAVRQGDAIGVEGSTGESTGNHLHFEVHVNGVVVNPSSYLP